MAEIASLRFSIDTARGLFLDSRPIVASLDKARRRILTRGGAKVRTIARNSIRRTKFAEIKGPRQSAKPYVHDYLNYRATISKPGEPPRAHTSGSEFGIKTILFVWNERTKTVIIGPVGRGSDHSVPDALEFGGQAITRVPRWARRRVGGANRIQKHVRARPFMRPALNKFKIEYPGLWKAALKPTATRAA